MTSALGWGGEVPQKQMKYERLHGFFSVIWWLIAYKGVAGLKKTQTYADVACGWLPSRMYQCSLDQNLDQRIGRSSSSNTYLDLEVNLAK